MDRPLSLSPLGTAPSDWPPWNDPAGSALSNRPHSLMPSDRPHSARRSRIGPFTRPPRLGGLGSAPSARLPRPAPPRHGLFGMDLPPRRSQLSCLGSATLGPAFLGSAPLDQLRPLGAIRPALSARPHRTSTLGSAPLDQPARIGPSRSASLGSKPQTGPCGTAPRGSAPSTSPPSARFPRASSLGSASCLAPLDRPPGSDLSDQPTRDPLSPSPF